MGRLSRLLGGGEGARDLLADLAEDYRAEAQHAARLRQHAERARYPQVATALRRLAAVEDRHAGWLRDRIVARFGEVPVIEPEAVSGRNQWERLVAAFQAAQRKRRRLIEQIAHWDPEEPDAAELFRRIRNEDHAEFPVYEGLIMRSDPQSLD
jgi:rubrerythrin